MVDMPYAIRWHKATGAHFVPLWQKRASRQAKTCTAIQAQLMLTTASSAAGIFLSADGPLSPSTSELKVPAL